MSNSRAFKKLIRRTMAEKGMTYMAAMQWLQKQPKPAACDHAGMEDGTSQPFCQKCNRRMRWDADRGAWAPAP